jgi:hypothetical protein
MGFCEALKIQTIEPGMVVHAYNLSTQKAKAGGLQV